MLKKERQAYILHQVHLHNKVLLNELCEHIKVSDDTIRRDLHELADEGKLIRVHGGALSPIYHKPDWSNEPVYSYTQKQIIAQKAVSLLSDGMFILSGGGTTIIEMARSLPASLRATFLTCSVPAALEYSKHPNSDVVIIGDKVSRNSKFSVGTEAIDKIKQIRSDMCLLGINAIDLNNGVSDNDWDVVQVKKAMIESSKKVVCLTIAEKINSVQPMNVCAIHDIDILITELDPDDPVLRLYVEAGIQVI